MTVRENGHGEKYYALVMTNPNVEVKKEDKVEKGIKVEIKTEEADKEDVKTEEGIKADVTYDVNPRQSITVHFGNITSIDDKPVIAIPRKWFKFFMETGNELLSANSKAILQELYDMKPAIEGLPELGPHVGFSYTEEQKKVYEAIRATLYPYEQSSKRPRD